MPITMKDSEAAMFDIDDAPRELGRWFVAKPPQRRFALTAVIKQASDGFIAVVPKLPGAISGGDSLDEAKKNIADAAAGVIECYLDDEVAIPWSEMPLQEDEAGENDTLFAFFVDV